MLLRLRITLLDQPGSLGKVTRVLGVAGADITQVVVLDRGEGRALDDITVYWPDAAPRQSLVQALESIPGVVVEGIWSTREGPDTYPELEILKYITTAGDRALATLLDSMPVLFSADWAAAGDREGSRKIVHSSWRAPEEVPFPEETPARPAASTLGSGLHVIAAPLPSAGPDLPAGPRRRPRLPPHRGAPPHPHPGDLPHPARGGARRHPPAAPPARAGRLNHHLTGPAVRAPAVGSPDVHAGG